MMFLHSCKLLCNDDLASIDQFAVLFQQVWNRRFGNVCVTDDFCQSPSFSKDPHRMGRKSPSPSWPPHRLLRCCCELKFQVPVFWWMYKWRYCGNFHRCLCCRHSLISTWFQRWSGYSRIHSFLRQNSTSSLKLRSFHVGSIALPVVFSELICT